MVELQALLELRDRDAKKVEKLADSFDDPRTREACRCSLDSAYEEMQSIRRELNQLSIAPPDQRIDLPQPIRTTPAKSWSRTQS